MNSLLRALYVVMAIGGLSSWAIAQGTPMEHGPGAGDMQTIHALAAANKTISRTVTNLPNGIMAVTESSDPNVARMIREHVMAMKARLEKKGTIRQWDPLFKAIFENADKFTLVITPTAKGVKITETSSDAAAVKLLQEHAKAVSGFVREGMMGLPKRHEWPTRTKAENQRKPGTKYKL